MAPSGSISLAGPEATLASLKKLETKPCKWEKVTWMDDYEIQVRVVPYKVRVVGPPVLAVML